MSTTEILHQRHVTDLGRMPPVLMGVASAAIGFAFHETADRTLSWTLLPALAAVIFWAGSFAFGIRWSSQFAETARANIGIHEAKAIGLPDLVKQSYQYFEKTNDRMTFARGAQQWMLLLGALSYLAGHIWFLVAPA